MDDDLTLLRQFVGQRDQRAFAALVGRHLHLVYFAALRNTSGDGPLAEDAAQNTFIRLARKAPELLGHPELAGWLHTTACFCARELARTEQRRHQRELTAHAMEETSHASAHDEAWQRVRPLIDDALLELSDEDRAAVLLRYFENQPFATIAGSLQLNESAARMRVERALGRLHTALDRRGVTSTTVALAAALGVPAALAVPAGLAGKITASALAATATVAAGTGILHLMASAKTLATVTGLAALLAIGTAMYQQRELASARTESAELRRRHAELQSRVEKLEARPGGASAPTATPSSPAAVPAPKSGTAPANPPATATEEPITHSGVQARYDRAKELARAGQSSEALREYLWCYDTGMIRIPSFGGVRNSFLLSSIAELGKNFPPALAALQERRDAAEKRVVADGSDRDAMMDYSSLNSALGEHDRSLVVFDALPAGDPRRKLLAYDLAETLFEAKRYKDFTDARPYSDVLHLFEVTSDTSRFKNFSAEQVARHRRASAGMYAKYVEALAGAGDLADARDFIGKILAVDPSFETRALLRRRLERAGHPELLPPAN